MKLRRIVFRLVIIPSVLLLILEIVLSLLGYPASFSSVFMLDEVAGYRFAPGSHLFSISRRNYEVNIDADGIADRYGEGRAKIVVLGDGVVAGLEHGPEHRLGYLIGTSTGETTVNLAVPGYGTVQQLIALDRWIKRYGAPETVLLVYNTTSDYFDNVQGWEGERIPGISGPVDEYEYIRPNNPGLVGEWLRVIVWNSRLYTLYEISKQTSAEHLSIHPPITRTSDIPRHTNHQKCNSKTKKHPAHF